MTLNEIAIAICVGICVLCAALNYVARQAAKLAIEHAETQLAGARAARDNLQRRVGNQRKELRALNKYCTWLSEERHAAIRDHAFGMTLQELGLMVMAASESEPGDVVLVVKAGFNVHDVWDGWTDQQRAIATMYARAVNSGVEDPGATPDFLAPYIREETTRDSDAGTKADAWNTCAKCGQLVDCDDVHDGCEVVCLGCSAVNVVVEAQDGSFELVLATRDSDAEPEA